jgi:hypothetical protein
MGTKPSEKTMRHKVPVQTGDDQTINSLTGQSKPGLRERVQMTAVSAVNNLMTEPEGIYNCAVSMIG